MHDTGLDVLIIDSLGRTWLEALPFTDLRRGVRVGPVCCPLFPVHSCAVEILQ
jgi:hypothetical protein